MAKTLGDTVREARIRKELSLRELARQLDKTASYLSDIENDRRIPSEEVLRQLSCALELSFDDLMALAGRFGEQAERYMRRNPSAGILFRRISEANLEEEQLKRLLEQTERMGQSGSQDK